MGPIERVEIPAGAEPDTNRGYAIATCHAETATAIASKSDVRLDGRLLWFDIPTGRKGDRRAPKPFSTTGDPSTALIVRNLAPAVTQPVLKELFTGCQSCVVAINPVTKASKLFAIIRKVRLTRSLLARYAHVEFRTIDDAMHALEQVNGTEFAGRFLSVCFTPSTEQPHVASVLKSGVRVEPTKVASSFQ